MYNEFWMVMLFYAILSCFIMPFLGYYIKGVQGLSQGYILGTVVSVILWFAVGKKMSIV